MRLQPMHYARSRRISQFEEDEWPRRAPLRRRRGIVRHVAWVGSLSWPLRVIAVVAWLNIVAYLLLFGAVLEVLLEGAIRHLRG